MQRRRALKRVQKKLEASALSQRIDQPKPCDSLDKIEAREEHEQSKDHPKERHTRPERVPHQPKHHPEGSHDEDESNECIEIFLPQMKLADCPATLQIILLVYRDAVDDKVQR